MDNDTSPLVQDLLRRTAEKKEDRKKERLADYYRRNFSDYFTFTEGNMKDLSPETQQEIKEWLKNNGVEGVTVPQYPPPEP